jgi:hypothetical protein
MGDTMGLLEEIEKKGKEKERVQSQRDMKEILAFLENYNAEELNGILSKIHELAESGLYIKLMEAFRSETYSEGWGTKNYADGKRAFTVDEVNHVRSLKLARKNLHLGGLFNTIFTPSMITAKEFLTIHLMIHYTYVVFSGKATNWNDRLNIYFSRLDERLMFALDNFDEVKLEDLPEPTPEYFQALKKLKWKNKNTEKLHNKLNEYLFEINLFILDYPSLTEQVGWITTYRVTGGFFIKTLAACNAVNNGRQEIEDQDIIKAYKTFFKLIKTDVTKYKAIPERVRDIDGYHGNLKHEGYLVCESCGGYYKLQPGESPDDFSDTCECGGELEFKRLLME